jgi:hypothetical protein
MTTCRECGEAIQFLPHPKTGKSTPYDDPLPPPPNHYQSKAHIDATRKNGAKPRKGQASGPPDQVGEAGKLLRDMNYTKAEAAEMLKDIPEAAPEAMVLAALTRMGAE